MNKQILLVEDDSAIMETLSLFLRYEGFQVVKARNSEQAEAAIKETKPDLVLLDYMLQEDTAEPIVKVLRAHHSEKVKVVLFTAADDPMGKAQAVKADAVVSKPFELDFLLETIRECLKEKTSDAAPLDRSVLNTPQYMQPAV